MLPCLGEFRQFIFVQKNLKIPVLFRRIQKIKTCSVDLVNSVLLSRIQMMKSSAGGRIPEDQPGQKNLEGAALIWRIYQARQHTVQSRRIGPERIWSLFYEDAVLLRCIKARSGGCLQFRDLTMAKGLATFEEGSNPVYVKEPN
jgi:hypothetical protein